MFKQFWTIMAVIFSAVLAIAGAFLIFDAFRHTPLQHATMNVEGIIALGFLALLFARGGESEPKPPARVFNGLSIAVIIIVIALAFVPILHTSFLYDDYTHITDASAFTWHTVAVQFEPVVGKGLFFRPLGFFFYWLNYQWAGSNPTWWHAANTALHAACCVLMYLLCREVGLTGLAGLGGTLLFGLAGVSAESVAWIDAGFVILTTVLVIISLIFVCRYATTGSLLWLIGALGTGACAMLSKETAFCLPFLVGSLAFFKTPAGWNRLRWATILTTAMTIVIFAYRWWALNGIGGYTAPGGEANILHFNLVRTIDALLLRQWAVLLFPFNWTIPSGPILRGALALTPFILMIFARLATPPRRPMIGCLVFIVAAGLPVQHLLLISPDLSGSRTLYLGCVGLGLLWALVLSTIQPVPRILVACVLLTLEYATLEHNLTSWRETSAAAQSACMAFGRKIAGTSGVVLVNGLPAIRNGAVFLRNGFPQCVELNSDVPAWRIQVNGPEATGARVYHWNEAHGRIE